MDKKTDRQTYRHIQAHTHTHTHIHTHTHTHKHYRLHMETPHKSQLKPARSQNSLSDGMKKVVKAVKQQMMTNCTGFQGAILFDILMSDDSPTSTKY